MPPSALCSSSPSGCCRRRTTVVAAQFRVPCVFVIVPAAPGVQVVAATPFRHHHKVKLIQPLLYFVLIPLTAECPGLDQKLNCLEVTRTFSICITAAKAFALFAAEVTLEGLRDTMEGKSFQDGRPNSIVYII